MYAFALARKAVLCLIALATATCQANNVQITSVGLVPDNFNPNYCNVTFNLSWENSWRVGAASRWDAAWVFVKYRTLNGAWQHVLLSGTGHTAAPGSAVDAGLLAPDAAYNEVSNPALGVFVRRDADGTGAFNANGLQLLWPHGAQGLIFEDIAEIQVFAVEMVHVTQGAFYLGSGGTEPDSFTDGVWSTGQATTPFHITSEGAIGWGNNPGQLWRTGFAYPGTVPAAFPKGHRAFYSMKYEITQQQYVDFLNTLTRSQQVAHVETPVPASTTSVTDRYVMSGTASPVIFSPQTTRNGIRCNATIPAQDPITFYCDLNGNDTGGEADDGQWLPANYLTWSDLIAYLDWSGLRPMTEMEYEKACRGSAVPVPNEYPWGTTTLAGSAYEGSGPETEQTLSAPGSANEQVATNYDAVNGNANYANTNPFGAHYGPKRVGIFAAHPGNTGRVTAGATLFGIMEMGGNVFEQVALCSHNATYDGAHGDGALAANGTANTSGWPVADNTAVCERGGSLATPAGALRTSSNGMFTYFRARYNGGRGVRTAP